MVLPFLPFNFAFCERDHVIVLFGSGLKTHLDLFLMCFILHFLFCILSLSSGIENNPTVFYRLMPGSTSQTNKYHTFYLQQRPDNGFTWADIKVNHPLDYETIKEYNLTIRVEVSFLLVFFITSPQMFPNFAFLSSILTGVRSVGNMRRMHLDLD